MIFRKKTMSIAVSVGKNLSINQTQTMWGIALKMPTTGFAKIAFKILSICSNGVFKYMNGDEAKLNDYDAQSIYVAYMNDY